METLRPETTTIELDVGPRTLAIAQLGGLSERAAASVRAHAEGPYWGYLWPSARALARVVGAQDLSGRRVLDLGSGVGALACAASVAGATVVAGDLSPEAVRLTSTNAEANALTVDARVLDWNQAPDDLGPFALVLAADVFYADGMLAGVLRFLKAHVAPDGAAWIADPMRVAPSGVAGAARFHGFEVASDVLVDGQMLTGGVTRHVLTRRRRAPRP